MGQLSDNTAGAVTGTAVVDTAGAVEASGIAVQKCRVRGAGGAGGICGCRRRGVRNRGGACDTRSRDGELTTSQQQAGGHERQDGCTGEFTKVDCSRHRRTERECVTSRWWAGGLRDQREKVRASTAGAVVRAVFMETADAVVNSGVEMQKRRNAVDRWAGYVPQRARTA